MNTTKLAKWVSTGAGMLMANSAFAMNYGQQYVSNIALGNTGPIDIVVAAVNWVLGILALIAVILVLLGGFKWMTAGGNEEKIEEAKKLLTAAVIGLVIILAAWGISLFAVSTIGNVTGANTR